MKTNKTPKLAQMFLFIILMKSSVLLAAEPAGGPSSPPVSKVLLEDYFLLALSASEEVAVLKGPGGQLETVRAGAMLGPAQARLVQVLGDRLRFEDRDAKGARQTVWMIRAASPDQKPDVQRVSGTSSAPLTAGGMPVAAGPNAARASDSPVKKNK